MRAASLEIRRVPSSGVGLLTSLGTGLKRGRGWSENTNEELQETLALFGKRNRKKIDFDRGGTYKGRGVVQR